MSDLESLLEDLLTENRPVDPQSTLPPALERYLIGDCHILAVALHRQLGWQMAAVLNDDAWFWEDPHDPDNGIPEVVHVYAIDPHGMAWDIRGRRPAQDMVKDCADFFVMDESTLSSDWMKSERELEPYVGDGVDEDGNPFDRPLGAYTDADVSRALEDALPQLSGHPAWPRRSPTLSPRGV